MPLAVARVTPAASAQLSLGVMCREIAMTDREVDPCEVCGLDAESIPVTGDYLHQRCPRCGEFKLSGTAATFNRRLPQKSRDLLSGWIQEQNLAGVTPMLGSDSLRQVTTRPLPSVNERANLLLRAAAKNLRSLGDTFKDNDPRLVSASYSKDQNDVQYLLRMLRDGGLIEQLDLSGEHEVLPDGHLLLGELSGVRSESRRGFVAMWFSEDLNEAYEEGFVEGIFDAGYDPLRIDQHEHVNRIDDEIVKLINDSRFVVADFTGHRGGVYFEAGYALGRELPVFWTCRKDAMVDLHFDIRQFNCIDWDSPAELRARLSTRIEAVLGPGPGRNSG